MTDQTTANTTIGRAARKGKTVDAWDNIVTVACELRKAEELLAEMHKEGERMLRGHSFPDLPVDANAALLDVVNDIRTANGALAVARAKLRAYGEVGS